MGIQSNKDCKPPTTARGSGNENSFLSSLLSFSLAPSSQDLSNPLFVCQIKGGFVLFWVPARKRQLEVEWHRAAIFRFVGGKFLLCFRPRLSPLLTSFRQFPSGNTISSSPVCWKGREEAPKMGEGEETNPR